MCGSTPPQITCSKAEAASQSGIKSICVSESITENSDSIDESSKAQTYSKNDVSDNTCEYLDTRKCIGELVSDDGSGEHDVTFASVDKLAADLNGCDINSDKEANESSPGRKEAETPSRSQEKIRDKFPNVKYYHEHEDPVLVDRYCGMAVPECAVYHLYGLEMELSCPIPEEQNTRGRQIYDPAHSTQGHSTKLRLLAAATLPLESLTVAGLRFFCVEDLLYD